MEYTEWDVLQEDLDDLHRQEELSHIKEDYVCEICEDKGYLVYSLTGMYNKRCKCNPDYGKVCREC